MKKINIGKMILGVVLCLLFGECLVKAEEPVYLKNTLVETITETTLYQNPDETSEKVATVAEHIPMFTTDNQEGDWIRVKIDEIEGYVKITNITLFLATGIEQEFENKENDFNLVFREIEYRKHEKQQKIVWGITIGALVVSIFAVGIVSTVLNDKKQKGKNKASKKVKGNVNEADYTDTML